MPRCQSGHRAHCTCVRPPSSSEAQTVGCLFVVNTPVLLPNALFFMTVINTASYSFYYSLSFDSCTPLETHFQSVSETVCLGFLPLVASRHEVNHSGCRCFQSRCFAKGGVNTAPRNTLSEAVHESRSLNIELIRAHSTCSSVKAVTGISALILTLSGS